MRNIKKIFLCILFTLTLNACGQIDDPKASNVSLLAVSRLDIIKENGVIHVGTTGDYMPFSYLNGGNLDGVDIELAKGLALSLNVEIEFVKTTWPTLMDDLMADKFDIGMSGITITAERQSIAMFSLPMRK
ncbi:MAG: transporter substrate-binding domain-containing protein, partial [Emcibacteraceae bacterium]|nr:transporter substrate-binding domain-containing protein [Emcibacteraceae bacterium]